MLVELSDASKFDGFLKSRGINIAELKLRILIPEKVVEELRKEPARNTLASLLGRAKRKS